MDDMHWFDAFHRMLVRDVDRRGLLRATVSMAANLLFSPVPLAATARKRKPKGKGHGKGRSRGRGKGNGKGKGKGKGKVVPQSDLCTDAPDDLPCAGECGVCSSGECIALSNACRPCHRCDVATFTCVPVYEGSGCAGECGTCQDGRCLPDGRRCQPCGGCDATTLVCVPDPDMEGQECAGECGTCISGTCLPNGTRCGPCGACDVTTLTCAINPVLDGRPCGDHQVCENGACVVVGSCPTVPACHEVVWDSTSDRYVEGRLLDCCDHRDCESCQPIPDASSPTGYRCDEFGEGGRCLRWPQRCRSLCRPETCHTCVAGQGYCESICDTSRQTCRAGICTCVPAGEPCPAGGEHYCCGGTCAVVAQKTVCA